MEKYKSSGIAAIGDIPVSWSRTKLKRLLATPITDGPHETPELQDDGVPFLSAEAVKLQTLNFDLKRGFITQEDHERFCQKCKPMRNDIFMVKSGATTGNVALVDTDAEFSVWSPLALIRCKSLKVYYKYVFLFLQSSVFRRQVELNWNYGTQQNIGMEVLGNLYISYPNLDKQQEISNYLDRKTAQIDNIIADKEKLIELLKEKRKAIISEAVTRGLDSSAPMKDSGVDWIGEVPAHWEIKPLFTVAFENEAKNSGNQCTNLLSLSYGKIIKKDIDTNFGLLPESFETYQIVENGYTILRLTDLQNDKRSLRSGFVSEKGIITSAYVGLIPANDVDGLFLSDLLHAYDLMKIFYSLGNGVRQSMNYKDLKRLPILLPPKSEQKLISNYLRNKTAEIDDLISTAEQQVSLFKEYRQSVISEAVTGKVAIS